MNAIVYVKPCPDGDDCDTWLVKRFLVCRHGLCQDNCPLVEQWKKEQREFKELLGFMKQRNRR